MCMVDHTDLKVCTYGGATDLKVCHHTDLKVCCLYGGAPYRPKGSGAPCRPKGMSV